MPKKKPAAKRLDKLFQNITPEDTSSKPKRAPRPKPVVEETPPSAQQPPQAERSVSISPPTRPVELIQRVPASHEAISLAFQAGQNNWATLQVLDDAQGTKWTPDDELLVRQVVDQLSLALENARLFKETESRATEVSVLNEVGQAFAATLNFDQITEITYNGISRLFDAKNFYVAFYDKVKNEVVFPRNVSESVVDRSITRLPLGKGITGHIIRTREHVLISNGSDQWMLEHGETPVGEPALSFLGVPLIASDNVLGVIAIQDYATPNKYSQHDLELLTSFANQAAIAIENARLFEEAQRRAQETTALAEVGREISSSFDLAVILEKIAFYAYNLLQATTTSAYLPVGTGEKWQAIAAVGLDAKEIKEDHVNRGEGVLGKIVLQHNGAIFNNVDKNTEGIPVPGTEKGVAFEHLMGVPVLSGDRVTGLLAVWRVGEGREFTQAELDFLTSLSRQTAIAIENARLFQETQQRAEDTARMNRLVTELSQTLDLGKNLQTIASEIADITFALHVGIAIIDKEANQLVVMADAPLENGKGGVGIRLPIQGNPTAERVLSTRQPLFINDTLNNPLTADIREIMRERGTQSLFIWPLVVGKELIGTLGVDFADPHHHLADHDRSLIESILAQIQTSVQNSTLFENTQRSEEELRALFTSMQDMVSVVDRDARYVRIAPTNPSRHFLLPEDILGKRMDEVLPPDAYKLLHEGIQKALETKETVQVEYKLPIEGQEYWFLANLSRLNETEVFWVARDITERKTNELIQAAETQISDATLTASTIEELIRAIHQAVGTLAPAKNFYLALYDAQNDWLTFPYYVDEYNQSMSPRKLGRGLTSYVIRTGKTLRTTPEIYAELVASGEVVSGGTTSVNWLGIPLRSETTIRGETAIRGVMAIQSYDASIRITPQHQETLNVLGNQIAASIERLLAREALAKSEADLRALFTSMQDVVLVVDRDTRYVRIAPTNPSRLFLPPEEMLGKRMDELLPPETHRPFHEAIQKALDTNEAVQIEYQLPIEGQVYWFLANLSRLNDNEVFWVARDITERKHSEEILQRRNKYLAISAEIGRLVTSTLDLDRIFTETVSRVKDEFGLYFAAMYSMEETGFNAALRSATGEAGEQLLASKHSVGVGSQTLVGSVAESGKVNLIEDVRAEPLYEPHPLLPETRSEAVIPLRIGARIVAILDLHSDQVSAFTEDDISVLQLLSDQVAVAIDNARSYELSQQLIKDLREVDKLKSQFLANMSHELRTPLNSIIGFSRVILKGIDGPITDMQQQDLTAIYNSGQHLLGLINDVLDLARIEAGKMELNFEEVYLADMIQSVLSTAKGLVKEKPIQLVSNVSAGTNTVRGDAMRIRQIFINLLSNASKFTDEGAIKVEAHNQKGQDGKTEVLIRVTDTGPGISLEDQDKLFKAFSQVDGSATRKSGGTGLGLSICANLVQLHGGRIGVDSEEGKGSTFWFTLQPYNQPLDEIPADRKVVIAIDDDPKVISLYERYLAPQGYYVIPFIDAKGAKDRIIAIQPHAITLDVMMPNIDGWTLLSDLKSDPATRDIPVVICSILEQADKGFNLGAADYLTKPILEEDLVHAMSRLDKKGQIHNILVIDDSPEDRRLIQKILSANGKYEVAVAEGGRQGWEEIKENPPHAVILDLFMPEWDGFTVLEKLREDPSLRNLPVLVISGGGLNEEQQKQLQDFGKRLLLKGSLKEGELISGIEQALEVLG
ncbi:MAG: GAF domain-containing protein [Anaerolineales bacterium]|nr:MAG: GAF domain-containing protein [Anaerolineales bacterium]